MTLVLVSCRTWFDISESTESSIAKSVGAEQTTKIKILEVIDPQSIGTFSIKVSCGDVQLNNTYNTKKNNALSEVVYNVQFKGLTKLEVDIRGINKSGAEYAQTFEVERSSLTEHDLLVIDPNLFIELFQVAVAPDYADDEMKDEVLEISADYILNRETHSLWLGYLQQNRPLLAIIPRQTYNEKHEFFRLKVKRMNVSTGESRMYMMKYKDIPKELMIDLKWYEQASLQDLELRKLKKDGASNQHQGRAKDAG